ncbi:MAG: UDP-N-acetylmuramoyl-L-alanyl-D-glutamate--2,6-diaminopimelate ligase [Bacteroidota bacterium]|nr:UDP-N-acetylmuramoyl-L-alanyl-D-glutamate--2,6-diaminopimelate ligase [Bacteroidota bacterium]
MKKNLKDILKGVDSTEIVGSINREIENISFDSRKCEKESLFIAVKGTQADGHKFISEVEKNSVSAIVCEELPKQLSDNITYIKTNNSRKALSLIASNYYNNPSKKINLVGITGTNGKTTTVTLLFNLFRDLGYSCGLISTIENKIDDNIFPATHTTPDPIKLNELLHNMVKNRVTHCFMEVSSHAIHQDRIFGLHFVGGIFSNLTQDHLDYHKTFKEYLYAKKIFFDNLPKTSWALTNIDDKNGNILLQNTKAKKYTYALNRNADFKAKLLSNELEGFSLQINNLEVWCRLVGRFNAYNLLATYATAILLGENITEVLTSISNLKTVEGRFDYTKSTEGRIVIIDYAHTPDALKNVLETINESRTHNETLISVIGAGGDRDSSKRPIMGKIAATLSNKVILTSDNPRNEDPDTIIRDIEKGIPAEAKGKVISITSRKEAIKTACFLSNPGDIILIAGKGHEKYQEINGVKQHFDDKEIINEYIK